MHAPDWLIVRKDADNKMPRCGGGGSGALRNQRDQGGGQVPDRLYLQQCRPVSVPHKVAKMPCRSED